MGFRAYLHRFLRIGIAQLVSGSDPHIFSLILNGSHRAGSPFLSLLRLPGVGIHLGRRY